MCCDGWSRLEDTVGECEECGGPIDIDGDATEGCNYSSYICPKCGYRPCDQSC